MATIHEFLRAARQMDEFQRQATKSLGSFDRISEQAAGINRIGESIAEMRLRMLALGQTIEATKPAVTSLAYPASFTSRSIASMLEASRPPLKIAELVGVASPDWKKTFASIEAAKVQSLLPVQSHFAKLYELSKIVDFSLRGLKIEDIGGRFSLDAASRSALADVHVRFGSEYRTLYESVTASESALVSLPKPLTELPAVEYLNQTVLITSTSEVELDADVSEASDEVQREYAIEAADQLTALLTGLNPDLPPMLMGARAVLESKHADYVRHFAASLRELFTHVLHLLAPDDALRAWSSTADDYANGRPTRRARLRYITRDIQDTFGGFLNADVDAALKFLDSFQKGTHALRPDFTLEEVLGLKVRMEGLIRFLLVINTSR